MVADALSRAAISAISGSIDFSALATAQLADPVGMAACRTAITGLQIKDIPFGPNNTTLLCAASLGSTTSPCTCLFPPSHFQHLSRPQPPRHTGNPHGWWPASMSGMASVARSENWPRHVLLENKPKSISIIVPHYLSTMNPYFDLTM